LGNCKPGNAFYLPLRIPPDRFTLDTYSGGDSTKIVSMNVLAHTFLVKWIP